MGDAKGCLWHVAITSHDRHIDAQHSWQVATFFRDAQDHDSSQVAGFAALVRETGLRQRYNGLDGDAQLPGVDQLADCGQVCPVGTNLHWESLPLCFF
jgi:hypothetical protein